MKHLVELEAAKRNLKVTNDADDDNLTDLLEQASAAVLDYLKVDDTIYDATEVPLLVQAATMLVIRSLYDAPTSDPITPAVESLLRRQRDPAFA